MTRIIRMHALGGPEVLQIDQITRPEPGIAEVRIRVAAIGLNHIETIFRGGGFGSPPLPSKIGYEAAGTIDAIGPGVSAFSVGDRVAVLPGISMEEHGTYGEEILCPADMLVRLDDDQPLVEAAATWMQYLTAYALQEIPNIGAGAVVITAASSSVGLAAIQIVNAAGGLSIATTRGRSKAETLRAHGAAHVVVTDEEPLAATVRALTQGRGAVAAFDAVAGETLAALTTVMAPGGTIILYGALGGDVASLNVHPLMMSGVTLRGYGANQVTGDPVRRAKALDYVRDGLASGALRPVIDRVFGFDEMVAAHRYLESNAQLGKIVVTVG